MLLNYFKGNTVDPPHTHECVDMIHPSMHASGAVIKSIGLAKVFKLSFLSLLHPPRLI